MIVFSFLFQLSYSIGFAKSVSQLILEWFFVDREKKKTIYIHANSPG